jgi:hypothetical protein
MESDFTVRDFNAMEDYEMVCDWWTAHDSPPVPLVLLPDSGFVAEHCEFGALVATWIYFDTTTPVCFASHLVSRPGLRPVMTAAATLALFAPVKERALLLGARVILMYAPKAIARYAEKSGFFSDRREVVNLAFIIVPEEAGVPCL